MNNFLTYCSKFYSMWKFLTRL